MVGILEGLYGTCTLLVALPFGTLADRWRRDRVLRICGILEVGALLGPRPIMHGRYFDRTKLDNSVYDSCRIERPSGSLIANLRHVNMRWSNILPYRAIGQGAAAAMLLFPVTA